MIRRRPILSPALVAVTSLLVAGTLGAEVVFDPSAPGFSANPGGNLAGPNFTVRGDAGVTSGNTLVHSLERFNVGTGESATFTADGLTSMPSVVVTRVTGGFESHIAGPVTLNMPADFFLMNPAGWVFGQGASLNTPGALYVTTANRIELGAAAGCTTCFIDASAAQPLTSIPGGAPTAFTFTSPTPARIEVDRGVLQSAPGSTLLLVGGDTTVRGDPNATSTNNLLVSPGGELGIISVADRGTLPLYGAGNPGLSDFGQLGTVRVEDRVALRAGDSGGGSNEEAGRILIRSGELFLLESILTSNYGAGAVGASGGQYGIDLEADRIQIRNKGASAIADALFIATGTHGTPDSKDIRIVASESVDLSRYVTVTMGAFGGTGDGGDLLIEAPEISITEGTRIFADSVSDGDAGSVLFKGNRILIDSSFASTEARSTGSSGDFTMIAGESVTLQDSFGIFQPALRTSLPGVYLPFQSPSSGDILIDAPHITLEGAALLSNSGGMRSGDISLVGESISLGAGTVVDNSVTGFAVGGKISLSAVNVEILDGSRIVSQGLDLGAGVPGDIDIIAVRSLRVVGSERGGTTGVFANQFGTGNSGAIELYSAGSLVLQDAEISTASDFSGTGGSIAISAVDDLTLNRADVSTSSNSSSPAGDISLVGSIVTLNRSSLITTSQLGAGGAISVAGESVLISPTTILDSTSGNEALTGEIQIEGGDVNLAGSLGVLPTEFLEASSLLANQCGVGPDASRHGSLNIRRETASPVSPQGILAPEIRL